MQVKWLKVREPGNLSREEVEAVGGCWENTSRHHLTDNWRFIWTSDLNDDGWDASYRAVPDKLLNKGVEITLGRKKIGGI